MCTSIHLPFTLTITGFVVELFSLNFMVPWSLLIKNNFTLLNNCDRRTEDHVSFNIQIKGSKENGYL